jgi:hypothetical protein
MIEDTKEMTKSIRETTRGNWPVILLLTLGIRVSPNFFPYLNRNCKFLKGCFRKFLLVGTPIGTLGTSLLTTMYNIVF